MATPEQIQKLVARIQAMEARETEGRAREHVLHGTVQELTTRLAATQQQTATLVPGGSTFATGTVDTKALGKLEVFEGNETKWHDFRLGPEGYKLFYPAVPYPAPSLQTATAIKRTQANIGPLPMDLDAFTKGKNKGAKNAWEKGKGKGGNDTKGKGKKGACY
eukprot:5970833-Amphidinium_carterae.1